MYDASSLNDLYQFDGPERVGFIVKGEVVEVDNIHPQPLDFFEVSVEDLEKYVDKAEAIWHTQPHRTSQLSYEDYMGFRDFPEHKHIIIGLDGFRVYKVEDGEVIKDSVSLRTPPTPIGV